MNQQPDTTTIEGKIAVMQAALTGKRIQNTSLVSGWINVSLPLAWSWSDSCKYRIHPDDLNTPAYRPWKYASEVPVGKTVKRKRDDTSWLLLGAADGHVHLAYTPFPYLDFFAFFIMEDGSPCGVKM